MINKCVFLSFVFSFSIYTLFISDLGNKTECLKNNTWWVWDQFLLNSRFFEIFSFLFFFAKIAIYERIFLFFWKNQVISQTAMLKKFKSGRNKKIDRFWPKNHNKEKIVKFWYIWGRYRFCNFFKKSRYLVEYTANCPKDVTFSLPNRFSN
jgi:hypothetical protein